MTKKKALHIIAFNIPFPADYGGIIDIFYKIIAFYNLGIDIHLHCFEYGRKHTNTLEKYCQSVNYYKRKNGFKYILSTTPYFIETRFNTTLLQNLIDQPYPILSEGIHCSKTILNSSLKDRKRFVRTHNIEEYYYKALAVNESTFWKKIYYYSEYIKSKYYEKKIDQFDGVFSISQNDFNHFKKITKSFFIRAFHSNTNIQSIEGIGRFALYHGNLSVAENHKAALFLIKEVFDDLDYQLIIAGKNPSKKLINAAKSNSKIRLIANPSQERMSSLISEAQMILLPTHQNTGIKLKLIESLHKGRFCIVNDNMIKSTELEPFCELANHAANWKVKINELKEKPFNRDSIEERKKIITIFNNEAEAQKMVDIIFKEK